MRVEGGGVVVEGRQNFNSLVLHFTVIIWTAVMRGDENPDSSRESKAGGCIYAKPSPLLPSVSSEALTSFIDITDKIVFFTKMITKKIKKEIMHRV